MEKIKTFLKAFIPPIFFQIIKLLLASNKPVKKTWSGNYTNWNEAKKISTGYEHEQILEKCKNALLKIKSGEAKYERDSVLFKTIQYSWPLLSALQKVALENNGNLTVVDFGGSLGSSYFQNKDFLNIDIRLKWCVVEQPQFVECGKKYFQNDSLFFYNSLDECIKEHKPQILLLNSVIPYIEKPYELLNQLYTYEFSYIFIDRTSFIDDIQERITLQIVPQEIYDASYPCWFLNESKLFNHFQRAYLKIADFQCYDTTISFLSEDEKNMYWKGAFFKKF